LYVGGCYEQRRRGNRRVHVFHIWTPERVVAQVTVLTRPGLSAETRVFYLHDDTLGSIQAVTDESGEVVESLRFDPYGERVDATDPAQAWTGTVSLMHFGFTGHEHDYEVNLINMRGRVYDPRLARFLSADPYVSTPYLSQSL